MRSAWKRTWPSWRSRRKSPNNCKRGLPSESGEILALRAVLARLDSEKLTRMSKGEKGIEKAKARVQERRALIADIRQQLNDFEATTEEHLKKVKEAYRTRAEAATADEARAQKHYANRLGKLAGNPDVAAQGNSAGPNASVALAAGSSGSPALAFPLPAVTPAAPVANPIRAEYERVVDSSASPPVGSVPGKLKAPAAAMKKALGFWLELGTLMFCWEDLAKASGAAPEQVVAVATSLVGASHWALYYSTPAPPEKNVVPKKLAFVILLGLSQESLDPVEHSMADTDIEQVFATSGKRLRSE